MERLFMECAIRAPLLVGLTTALLYVMRVKDAIGKHRVWTGVMALMLFLPVWATSGPKVSLRLLPPLYPVTASAPVVPIGGFNATLAQSLRLSNWELLGVSAYLLGFCVLVLRLVIGTLQTQRLVRGAVLRDGVYTSPLCTSPVTVGFFRPMVIFPENWREWEQSRLHAIFTHEEEHARRHDSLVQWFALLNRAVFWFHPVAWWLQRTLSGLAEEACDDVVLRRGHNASEYAECLLEIAKSVSRSGMRLNIVGMTAPGDLLRQRLRKIMEVGPPPRISSIWMGCIAVVCGITCTLVAAGTLDHAKTKIPPTKRTALQATAQPSTKFVLGDLKIEGEVHDRDKVQETILRQWQGKEFSDVNELAAKVVEVGVRNYFQERGYFKVLAHDPVRTQLLAVRDGKQQVSVTVAVTQGEQYRLGAITFRSAVADRPLSIPTTTLREQFNLRQNDVFNAAEVQAGLEKLKELYKTRGFPEAMPEPRLEIDDAARRIDMTVQVAEKPDKS